MNETRARSKLDAATDPAAQARREIGHTEVSRRIARLLVLLVGLAVATPPVVQTAIDLAAGRGPLPAWAPLLEALRDATAAGGVVAANRRLLGGIDTVETKLEDDSWLRQRLLPPTQWLLTGGLGLGNEQVIAGDAGWWFLAADFAHATGRGFLDRTVLARRQRDESIAADPLPALAGFAAQLERRRIHLLVVPVPAKPTVVPSPLASRRVAAPVHNPSHAVFLERLAAAGVDVYDPTADLLAVEASAGSSFLRTDTHWSPPAVDRVAAAIAERLRRLGVAGRPGEMFRRRAAVSGRGDLVTLLRLPPGSRLIAGETVELEIVLTATGDGWLPTPGAETLLLGDSFTNVFSEPGLGWGNGAGLAEQVSFHLGAPVDRIARNAGGAERSRSELAAELAADPERLAGTRVVVYQFAARELSGGDWRPIELARPR